MRKAIILLMLMGLGSVFAVTKSSPTIQLPENRYVKYQPSISGASETTSHQTTVLSEPGTDSTPSSTVATGQLDSLELTFSLDGDEFRLGESVRASLSLQNLGSETILLDTPREELFTIVVYDDTGAFLGVWLKPKLLIEAPLGPVVLGAGGIISQAPTWSGWITDASGGVVELGAGTYIVQAQVESSDDQMLSLTTSMLGIEIAAPFS